MRTHGWTTLMTAVQQNECLAIQLIENGCDLNEHKCHFGRTPIILCSHFGNIKIAKKLIKFKANVNLVDSTGYSSLIHAAIRGNNEIVKLLIENDADINYSQKSGHTALVYTIVRGHTDTSKILIDLGANVRG